MNTTKAFLKSLSILGIYFSILILMGCANQATTSTAQGTISPQGLTCEYLPDPSVVDVAAPRLGWINLAVNQERGLAQNAYQIRVASTKAQLKSPDLWDSEKVISEESTRIEYGGKSLESRQECWWQVRVWDQSGNASEWSKPGFWRMGLLRSSDWQAEWIGAPWQGEEAFPKPDGGPDGIPKDFGPPAPMLRKEFEVKKEVAKAVAYVTGLGYFELYANGEKVGDDVLVPNQTNYGKRPNLPKSLINVPDDFRRYKVMYLAYDLTEKLKPGKNVIGSIVGNGFYNPAKFWCEGYGTPRFLGQLHLTYTDGSEEVIVSDESWKIAKSPILMNMVYYGETYDAREEQSGWSSPDFDDSAWENAGKKKAPEGELVAHTAFPDQVTERIPPVSIEKLGEGHYQVDFGVEISGWVRLNDAEGPAGHRVDISFNSNLYSGENSYTFKGEGPENYAPRFNWFVFSGIEVKNWPGELKPEHLTAEAVNTYVEETAVFETSNPLFNELNNIWKRSQTDNMHGGIASDCPHRERNGYTGDGQVACATVIHNFDARNFYHKWIQDMYEAQIEETGYVPNGAPWQPGCGGGVAWGAAICLMPWDFYVHYGSLDMLQDNYEGMKGYVRYMQTWVDDEGIMFSQRKGANGEVVKWFNLGEWVSPGEPLPDAFVHTFYYWHCVDIAAKTARILGKKAEASEYAALAEAAKEAFHQRFYDAEQQTYGNGGGNILALRMGVPDEVKAGVLQSLKENIASNDGHLNTGIFGTRFFFEVLAENGMNQLAYVALNKTTEPSFGHWVALGSTTTREKWDEGGSHNHPMFGGGFTWLYRNLAGMQANPAKPGYKEIIFKPQPVDDLSFVTYKNETVYGEAGISWKQAAGVFSMEVTVPVGTTAQVFVPAASKAAVTESGAAIGSNQQVRFLREEAGYVVLEVLSGTYQFSAS
jgi:alpha-L-rhamnosidase